VTECVHGACCPEVVQEGTAVKTIARRGGSPWTIYRGGAHRRGPKHARFGCMAWARRSLARLPQSLTGCKIVKCSQYRCVPRALQYCWPRLVIWRPERHPEDGSGCQVCIVKSQAPLAVSSAQCGPAPVAVRVRDVGCHQNAKEVRPGLLRQLSDKMRNHALTNEWVVPKRRTDEDRFVIGHHRANHRRPLPVP
jgi:hypothetical protein